jgi:hypothetical protein
MPGIVDWIGYLGSSIVLISLLMGSIKKLRWINLVGAVIFAVYGFLIPSLPTGIMNVGIALIDIYYLIKIYQSKDYFRVQEVEQGNGYLGKFIEFYKEDIEKYLNLDEKEVENASVKFYVLRNMTPASIFVAKKQGDDTLNILLDYAIPQYRDLKIGKFVYEQQTQYFKSLGVNTLLVETNIKEHIQYVKKMGFVETSPGIYEKSI